MGEYPGPVDITDLLLNGLNSMTFSWTDTVNGNTGISYELWYCNGKAFTSTPSNTHTSTPTYSPTPIPTITETSTATSTWTISWTPTITFTATSTSTPVSVVVGSNCWVSDTTHNLMYVNPCSATTIQSQPPSDSSGVNWLSPNYNTASVSNWTAPTVVTGQPWSALCSLTGSGGQNWIAWDNGGDNPCGSQGGAPVADLFFRNAFPVSQGCTVSGAQIVLSADNAAIVWLNGVTIVPDGAVTSFTSCVTETIPAGLFQGGLNVLAFEVINYPDQDPNNLEGLTYQMCYNLSCQSTATATPIPTITVTPTPSYTWTYSPTPIPTITETYTPTVTMTWTPTTCAPVVVFASGDGNDYITSPTLPGYTSPQSAVTGSRVGHGWWHPMTCPCSLGSTIQASPRKHRVSYRSYGPQAAPSRYRRG